MDRVDETVGKSAPRVPLLFIKKVLRGLYFLPAFITLCSMLAALGFVALDNFVEWTAPLREHWWNDPSSARAFFSTSAGVMITIVSVSFSVVVVALTLASNQFCPRVLRQFVEDRINRMVFGVLIGNFAYAMVGLSALDDKTDHLPGLTLSGCFLYNLASTACFIYFIHHIVTSLQVDDIVTDLRKNTLYQINKLKSREDPLDSLGPADTTPWRVEKFGKAYRMGKVGYVQAVRVDELLEVSKALGKPIHAAAGLGDFVTEESPCIQRLTPDPDENTLRRIAACFEVDYSRLLEDDISYGFRETVDIALKSISPAVNDPTTAVMCIQNLTAMFEALCRDGWPPTSVRDSDSDAVLHFHGNTPLDYLTLCTDQIIYFAAASPRVAEALLEFLFRVADCLGGEDWKAAVREKGDLMVDASSELPPFWRDRLRRRREKLEAVLRHE